ncbi:hypothetical protein QUF80_06745 [Desulfococcaceae bacterium HSG8]|nr:hypothetical protein [Desulfococcaceae bacterium HSG8]
MNSCSLKMLSHGKGKFILCFFIMLVSMNLSLAKDSFAAAIEGTKFNDLNNNGVMDSGEPVFVNHNVFIRNDSTGRLFPVKTDDNGYYSSEGHDADTFTLWTGIPSGWRQTTPVEGEGLLTYTVDLTRNETRIIDFGIADSSDASLPSECSGDVNGDGEITPADALCIFNKYLGNPSCLD